MTHGARRGLRNAVLGAALALGVAGGAIVPEAEAASVPVLWVRATAEAPAATLLHLQPKFATVLRSDRRIDTVAIGDPRMVTATAVHRGQDAFDLVLQPQVETGMTNMVVWYGDLATVWMLEIGPGHRTADIVHVVTAAAAGTPRPQAGASPALGAPTTGGAGAREGSEAPAAPLQAGPPARPAPGSAAPAKLEVRQVVDDVTAVFQAIRIPDGVMIRYRITNGGRSDLTIRPGSVLVKVNGRIVPYGMARASADRGRPEIVPRGATETGVIDAPGGAVRTIRLILSLFPAGSPDDQAEETALPVTFQPVFNEVDRLVISSGP